METSQIIAIRQAFLSGIPSDSAQFGVTLSTPAHLYAPPRHATALDPNTMVVEGIRGAGKSLCWASLLSSEHRKIISKSLPKAGITEDTDVQAGFGTGLRASEAPTKDIIAKLVDSFDPRMIWRTVVGYKALGESGIIQGDTWAARVEWVKEHPEEFQNSLDDLDLMLTDQKKTKLIIFDALDTAADDWDDLRNLLRGLLQTTLEFRSFRSIRLKIFLRPDMIQDQRVTNFPDGSKVLSSKAQLSWGRSDLYGLLWQLLANAPDGGSEFRSFISANFKIDWHEEEGVWNVPQSMRREEDLQRSIFHELTGPWMGKNHKRGFPYTWLPNHLADSFDQASPRSFQVALREAAQYQSAVTWQYPLHHEGIRKGVQEASRIRVREITEDYLWVSPTMDALRGKLTVPCRSDDVGSIWKQQDTLISLEKSEGRLGPQRIAEGTEGIIRDLKDLGIFSTLTDERLQMPDVYRVAFGIGRKGGVKPLR